MQEQFEDLTGAPEGVVDESQYHVKQTEETYENQEIQDETVEETAREDPQERNWREMRETLKELKKQNESLTQKLTQREQQEAYQQYQMQAWQQAHQAGGSEPTQQQEDESIDDDDLITAAQAKNLAGKWARQEVEKYLKEQEAQIVPQKLQQQYNDYNQIVNQDNVQRLIQDDPETAEDIEALKSDPMRMSRMLYKTLKARYGQKDQEEDAFAMAKKKQAEEKQEKAPASSSAVPKRSALAEANAFAQGLTPDLKKQLLKEMDEAAKYH
ncbi:MAG: hypothetical protein PVI43_00920 [Candidatus Bathyarchaeota archaeon]|jgi:hypothetical protein